MDEFINWFRDLSRAAKATIILAVCLFTPAVSLAFGLLFGGIGAVFSIIGFVLGFINWGVALAILCGYGMYRVYVILSEDDDEDDNSNEDDSWLRY